LTVASSSPDTGIESRVFGGLAFVALCFFGVLCWSCVGGVVAVIAAAVVLVAVLAVFAVFAVFAEAGAGGVDGGGVFGVGEGGSEACGVSVMLCLGDSTTPAEGDGSRALESVP
jgi:hypothetical protein